MLVRCFIALPLPEEVKAEMRRVQSALAPHFPERAVHWTKPEQFHLTLDFLGELSAEEVARVKRWLGSLRFPSFTLELSSIGSFGRPARVLFINVAKVETLHQLQQEVALSGSKQPFQPHLTLARLRTSLPNLQEVVRNVQVEPLVWHAKEVQLVQSTLTPQGARYEVLLEVGLEA